MAKLIVVVLVVALVGWWLFGGARRVRRDERGELPGPQGLLRCAHCGVHLPQDEALRLGDRVYCSAAHRDAGPRAP